MKLRELHRRRTQMSQDAFYNKYYKALEGATILKFVEMRGDEFGGKSFPVFSVMFSDGSVNEVEVSQDEEGNGGGFLFGLPVPA
jgi:hypothetical protein